MGVYGIYALTNAWFVARGVGPTGLAAVNLVAPLLLFVGALGTTVGVGGASLASRSLGAGDPASAARAAGTAFTVFWTGALATTVIGLLALDPLLTALGARGAVRDDARDYATVLLLGAVTATGFSSLVRAEGRMRFSTLLWVVPVLVQITLDPVLIYGLHLGVRGAALGTVAGQSVSAVMSLWFFFLQPRRPYRLDGRRLLPDRAAVADVLAIGAPSFLAGLGATVLTALVNHQLAATGGIAAVAAYAVAARVQTFAVMPQLGITQGVQPVLGYNAGAGRWDRVHRARTLSLTATIGYGCLAALATAVLAHPIAGLFLTDPALVDQAAHALRLTAPVLAAAGVTPLVAATCQALGRARPAYALSVGTVAAIKIPVLLAAGQLGTTGTLLALPAGEIACAATALGAAGSRARALREGFGGGN